jgi:threonine dehydrogenase-like Zn-dependent dehydrogenase
VKALQFNVNVARFVAAKALRVFFGNRVFYRGPVKTVRLVDIPEPDLLTPEWVKVKTLYCGFCGSDLNLIFLHDSPSASPFTSFPCIIGHEMVAEIIETGDSVQGFQNGDIVAINPGLPCETRGIDPLCQPCQSGRSSNCENFAEGTLPPGMFLGINSGAGGGFAPYLVAHRSQLYKVPEGMSQKSAVMTEPVAVALQTLFDNMPIAGENVLVIGSGVIGNLVIQSIRALVPGCTISVIEPSSFASSLAKKAGADDVIPSSDIFNQTTRITGARFYKPLIGMEIPMGGFDRVYDTVGISSTLNLGIRLTTAMGTLSVVGIGGDAKLDLTPLWLKIQTIKGVYAYGHVEFNGERQHVFEIALDIMRAGKIQADTLITHEFGLEDYRHMIEVNLNKEENQVMKTVVAFK